MDKRIPFHLKGKELERGYSPPPRKRIRAPDLDTSELIEANSLTLMGRLTNPSVQRLWSLFPFLSNRWNLRGKAIGSDLGKGCFQFKFDFEEDMQKVLENRSYHYDQWMVILQKWEPVISDSFPSLIPFWIEIQGLPKHYWQPEMLKTIGEELGEILEMEITSATVKFKLLINGLQPLVKETIVDFPDGSEALVYLDYKNLKNHCHHCLRLSHETKLCPGLTTSKMKSAIPTPPALSLGSKGDSRNYYTPRDNFKAPVSHQRSSTKPTFSEEVSNPHKRSSDHRHERRGFRSAERSSGAAGPRNSHSRYTDHQGRNHYRPLTTSHSHPHNTSRKIDLRDSLRWREKAPTPSEQHQAVSDSSRTRRPPLERDVVDPDPVTPPPPSVGPPPIWRHGSLEATSPPVVIPSRDQVLGELREVTVQYVTCADPTESAARRQRVIQGEARNLMSDTADQIIEAAVALCPGTIIPELIQNSTQASAQPLSADLPVLANLVNSQPKRGRGRPPLAKPPTKPISKLSGVKSQKRNLLQGSPKKVPVSKSKQVQNTNLVGVTRKKNLPRVSLTQGEGSSTRAVDQSSSKTAPPKIALIPAAKKNKMDFQNPSTPLP